jgi:hypothetical protein
MLVPSQMNQTGTACGRPSGLVVLTQIERKALSGKSTLFQGIKPGTFFLLSLCLMREFSLHFENHLKQILFPKAYHS